MAITLYRHNAQGYEAALHMLAENGKAAIVHPTGTGKSFIGFKLCEDNPDKNICWLSPSEYIFRTQIENLKAASNGYAPENVQFFTYAKLMLMEEAEIAVLRPDFIILDEFHRCGAELWGQGVRNLLNAYPNVPILGLSATNIRYLDNQRDMADELFDGNVASEMTLGEAIVRGILAAPKYVQSVYSYQKDLKEYERRVRQAKSKAVQDAGQRYLEALRRAIEKADGLDVIFDRHMTDRTGKYIIFCADKAHMDEMMAHTEWFAKVDRHPKIYSLYTEDASASKEFQAFKEDRDTTHLRLLYAIDALNEGVHVEGVSGVILLRPTISPIIYKQQIGRALSASKSTEPIIFDIVNNIENLYSIGAIEEEMRAAVTYYRYWDKDEEIVQDRFAVYDEVKNCRAIFEDLEDALTASWDYMYAEAGRYYREHGDLEVPRRYKTVEGYSLGSWLQVQRKVRAGEQLGKLDADRIGKLDAIGMRWESVSDVSWQRYFAAAKAYFEQNGDLNVKTQYVTPDGIRLGVWICNLRSYRRSGAKSRFLTPERMAMLEAIGMIWDQPDYVFERNYAAALEYFHLHGDLNVPVNCTFQGVKLGIWIRNLRAVKKKKNGYATLSQEQIQRLEQIGMCWEDRLTALWNQGYAQAKNYYEAQGDLNVLLSYVSETGYPLGKWLYQQREAFRKGKLPAERVSFLDALEMPWKQTRKHDWEVCFGYAKQFFEANGDLDIPPEYKAGGIWLHKWLNEQKHIYLGKRKGKSLSQTQIAQLEGIGMQWNTSHDRAWERQYALLLQWYEREGHIHLPAKSALGVWMTHQRKKYRDGQLTADQISRLTRLGMVWETDDGWENGFFHAKAFVMQRPGEPIPSGYTCKDGYKLGTWWSNQRQRFAKGKMPAEQAERLAQLGLHPGQNRFEDQWQANFALLKAYVQANHREPKPREKVEGVDLHEWLRTQRMKYRSGELEAAKIALLESVPIDWLFPAERTWENYYAAAERYYRQNDDLDVPATYMDENGLRLGRWVRQMRASPESLTPTWANGNKQERLSAIGMKW